MLDSSLCPRQLQHLQVKYSSLKVVPLLTFVLHTILLLFLCDSDDEVLVGRPMLSGPASLVFSLNAPPQPALQVGGCGACPLG
jgi:hypothetical protein